ncbi:uncharacterized protein LOC120565377 [Perca fluviatilis]|uniref:uncharacterized protein LOC120565377 n=1 Tax=Perca fluviatilis TaxID=8168 RepID=UPI0019650389|nr:uncharacterized protein LOC120565377 [Perca fluviatilis]
MLSLPLWRLIVQWEAESILRHANPSAPTELIMLSASQLTSGKPASSQSSVNSIPHRTRLPLALVSKSPYAGIMWVAILPMQAVADLPLDAYCLPLVAMAILPMLAKAPLPLEAMAIHPVPVALLTMVAMANLPMQAVADLPLDAYCLPLVAMAILPMLAMAPLPTEVMAIHPVPVALLTMVAMAILTKKSSIIGPHSVPITTSKPSIAAMDRTQLSTPFAPGLVLGATPALEARTEIHHTTLKQP